MPDPLSRDPQASETAAGGEIIRAGRYVVTGSLGAGSQGETLEAVDKREGRAVAIKRFTIRGAKTWKDVELAEREASVLASLTHPNLPHYVEHFEENGALYLVMEKVEGESLAARRRRGAALNHEQVLRFLRDVAECLRYLHSHTPPIVHRDIKPGNVILRPDGSYCLVDFGSVRDRLKPEGGSTVVGTFGFMAPEQFQGRAAPASDVYAVGATALCLITGQEPEDLPHKGLAIDVEGALRGQVDRRLIGALRSMLEPDPDRRPSSVDSVLRSMGLAAKDSAPAGGPRMAEAAKKARRARLEAEDGWGRDSNEGAWHHQGQVARHVEHEVRRRIEREARKAKQTVKREIHRAKREAYRAERRARRSAEGSWQRPGAPVVPRQLLGTIILLALDIASVATFALFQVLLPILFTLLYNRNRRQRMLEIGQTGQRGLRLAREHIRYKFLGGPMPAELQAFMTETAAPGEYGAPASEAPRAASRSPGSRVAIDAEAEEAELDAEAAAEAEEAAKQARR
jgi:Protein kinase domain